MGNCLQTYLLDNDDRLSVILSAGEAAGRNPNSWYNEWARYMTDDGFGYNSNVRVITANGLNDQYYNNLAPRHLGQTANLNFVDGHASNMPITTIMAKPKHNRDL